MAQKGQTKTNKDKSHFKFRDQLLPQVVDQIRDAVMVWDAGGKLILFNESASNWNSETYSGVFLQIGTRAEELWRSFYDYVVDQSNESADAESFINGVNKEAFVNQRIPKKIEIGEGNGEFYNPILDSFYEEKHSIEGDGTVISVYCDLTRERRHQRDSDRMLQAFERMGDVIFIWDEHENLITFNVAAAKFMQRSGVTLVKGLNYDEMNRLAAKYFTDQFTEQKNSDIQSEIRSRSKLSQVSNEKFNEHHKSLRRSRSGEIREIYNPVLDVYLSAIDTVLPDGGLVSVIRDITEEKRRERDLKVLGNAIEYVPDEIVVWSQEGRLMIVNNAAQLAATATLGSKLRLGMHFRELLDLSYDMNFKNQTTDITSGEAQREAYITQQLEDFMQLLRSGEVVKHDRFNSITEQHVESIITPLPDGGVIIIDRDVTESKEQERKLNALANAVEHVSDEILVWDDEYRLSVFNASAQRAAKATLGQEMKIDMGYAELMGMFYDASLLEERKEAGSSEILGSQKHREEFVAKRLEMIRVRETNNFRESYIPITATYKESVDSALPNGGWITINRDVTEIKQQERELRALVEAIQHVPAQITVWNSNQQLVAFNENSKIANLERTGVTMCQGMGMDELFGLMYDNLVTRNYADPDTGTTLKEYATRDEFISSNKEQRFKKSGTPVVVHLDGKTYESVHTPLPNGGAVSMTRDVTEVKQREKELGILVDELALARDLADKASETKSLFVANMSHELRTPLNAVIGLAELLKEEAEDDGLEDYKEPLERIHSAGNHLLNLINDVLDVSKIEAGKIDFHIEEFAPKGLIEEVVATTQQLAEGNNNDVKVEFGEALPLIRSDKTRVRQIVFNLVANACKFTHDGFVKICVKQKLVDDLEYIDIEVADSGIGMTDVQVAKLFSSFVQADSSTTRKYGGTGLGLAISKQLAEKLGGSLEVESQLGEGSIFTASLPVFTKIEEVPAEEGILQDHSENKVQYTQDFKNVPRILVIDDDPIVLDMMSKHLSSSGFEVLVAEGGKQGIEMARRELPSVITLDILMPGMDGWSVLRTLKADAVTANIPVIMASILDEQKQGFALGANDYVSKPINRSKLMSAIKRFVKIGSDKQVLIVEDDADSRMFLNRLLRSERLEVVEAVNGKDAFDLLVSTKKLPELILLDLMMPIMNGFEFLSRIREVETLTDIPVLVITAADLSNSDKERLRGSVENVIQKDSVNKERMLEEITNLISSNAQ